MVTSGLMALLVAATPSPETHPFFTRAYWEAFKWVTPESAAEFSRLPEFSTYDPAKHRVHESKTLRRGPLFVQGVNVEASILERDSGSYEFPKGIRITWPDTTVSTAQCRSLFALLEKGLGPPKVTNDFSRPGDDIDFTILRAQWDVGVTRANLYCLIFDFRKARSTAGAVIFHAWHVATGEEELLPIWIRCSQKLTISRGAEVLVEQRPDLVLGIDRMERGVYTPDRERAGTAEISNDRISITRKDDERGRRDEVVIDRRTGQYLENRYGARPGISATVHGECVPFDPEKRKF
jgi:hypothetical protein